MPDAGVALSELARLRELERRSLRAAVEDLLAAADKADRFMGGTQPYVHTATIRRILAPHIASRECEHNEDVDSCALGCGEEWKP